MLGLKNKICLLIVVTLVVIETIQPFTEALVFRSAPPLEQELGSSPTLSRLMREENYYFDPFELATDENFARYREAELKHGRVCMLATIGMVVPHVYSELSEQVSFLPKLIIPRTALITFQSLTAKQYLQVIVTCAVLEAFVFVQQDPTDMPGDYGTGYFSIRDKGENERSLISELENGRLAMLAFVAQVVLELVTGKNVVEQWQDILKNSDLASILKTVLQ